MITHMFQNDDLRITNAVTSLTFPYKPVLEVLYLSKPREEAEEYCVAQ